MRPRIIDYLHDSCRLRGLSSYIVPDPAFVYAAMLGVGIVLFVRRCDASGLSKRHSTGIALWASIAALIGGRLFFLLQHLAYTVSHPSVVFDANGATVSFGVYIGGVLGTIFYGSMNNVAIAKYLDVAASVLGIGPMIGRLACFLNGDDYGRIAKVPWGVRFPHGSYPFLDQVHRGLISPMDDLSLPVHPVQLYGSFKGLVLFVLFTFLAKRKLFRPGVLFCLFWLCYAACRFTLEFYRGDDDRGWVWALSTGQFASTIIALAAIGGIFILENSDYQGVMQGGCPEGENI